MSDLVGNPNCWFSHAQAQLCFSPCIPGTQSGAKVLNIQTQGGKILSGPRGSSVVTVNPKTLHLTTMKGASGITGESA